MNISKGVHFIVAWILALIALALMAGAIVVYFIILTFSK